MEETKVCESCGAYQATDPHPCPYDEELGNGDKLCTCCYACRRECLMDI